jgi:hypothetical protein
VRYTELGGEALLYDPVRRALHRLSPAAAVVWHRFDGRTLGEIGEAGPPLGPIVELARRLRLLGVAEDARPVPATPSPLDSIEEIEKIGWPGRLVERSTGLTLELIDTGGQPLVPLDRALLHSSGGEPPIDAVVIGLDGSNQRRQLNGIEAVQAIVEILPGAWFGPDDALDRVADLVEAVPIFDTRDPDTVAEASRSK